LRHLPSGNRVGALRPLSAHAVDYMVIVVELEITNMDAMAPYREAVGATLAQYGGRFLTSAGAPGPLRHGHRRRDGVDAAKRLQHRLHDLWCHLLVGGVIGMALMRPESETMRWASEMPEAAVEPT
jgi:hypothetical protein